MSDDLTKMTQNLQVLRCLQTGQRLTALDALRLFGCFRLGARIYHLRTAGHQIHRRLIYRDGKRFAEYWMED